MRKKLRLTENKFVSVCVATPPKRQPWTYENRRNDKFRAAKERTNRYQLFGLDLYTTIKTAKGLLLFRAIVGD